MRMENVEYRIENMESPQPPTQAVGKISAFTDLRAWQEGHKLVLDIYSCTKNFPQYELFGLVNQMRRAAISFTSNIAEGFRKRSRKEKMQFFTTALASLTELQNQCIIARDVEYMDGDTYVKLSGQSKLVSRITNGLMTKTKTGF